MKYFLCLLSFLTCSCVTNTVEWSEIEFGLAKNTPQKVESPLGCDLVSNNAFKGIVTELSHKPVRYILEKNSQFKKLFDVREKEESIKNKLLHGFIKRDLKIVSSSVNATVEKNGNVFYFCNIDSKEFHYGCRIAIEDSRLKWFYVFVWPSSYPAPGLIFLPQKLKKDVLNNEVKLNL